MPLQVDVAIIGAGSAGLSALREVRKRTEKFVLINAGPYGTTCARVGCMPSKALLQVANDFHRRHVLGTMGILGANQLRIDIPEALRHIRSLRDRFVSSVLKDTDDLGDKNIQGKPQFLNAHTLKIGQDIIEAKKTIIATGSHPVIPAAWQRLGNRLLTSDNIFEQEDFPARIAVVGLGPIGLELGQALRRLGVEVIGFDKGGSIGGLTDPTLIEHAREIIQKEFPIHLNQTVDLHEVDGGIQIKAGEQNFTADKVLLSLGAQPNLEGLGLENLDIELDKKGLPPFDPCTMQVEQQPLFIAGDASAFRPLLHEAADEGFIAGYNSVNTPIQSFSRRTPLTIVFSEPQIATAGRTYATLRENDFVTGEVSFESQGRALTAGKNQGRLRVYAEPKNGRLLGTEMIAPEGEHLAHLLAWSIQQKTTVSEVTQMPFYHPVLEEGLRTALLEIHKKLGGGKRLPPAALCDSAPEKALC